MTGRALALLLALGAAQCGAPRPLSGQAWRVALMVGADALIYEDCMQTLYFTQRGFSEVNPVLQRHPQPARVLAACAVGMIVNTVPSRYRAAINATTILAELWVVTSNLDVAEGGKKLRVGLRWRP